MNTKILIGIGLVAVIVASFLVGVQYGKRAAILGGTTAANWDAASFSIGGTEIVSSARAGTFTGVTNSGTLTQTGAITNTAATSTLGCLRIYQVGATTVASTTYYLVASTTVDANNYFPLLATSSKPAYCN